MKENLSESKYPSKTQHEYRPILAYIHDIPDSWRICLIQELKCLTKDENDFIITQISYRWDEFNCTLTNIFDRMFKWVDQMFKLNDQKIKMTLQSACWFSTGRNWIVRLMNLNDKSVKIAGKTYNSTLEESSFLFILPKYNSFYPNQIMFNRYTNLNHPELE